ncbi:cobalamin biosynthesis protein [Streptomyces sp. NPDC093109]|uniref:cobalamin biosynthesis protein n=1 Tax=Streptomyces sp. NPDC093109 TaxID=3154977 RepID=UPI00344F2B86
MAAVGDPLRGPAAEQRHEERAERDEDRHGPLHSRSDGSRACQERGAEGAGELIIGELIVGVGASSGASTADVLALIAATLRDAGLPPESVVELATVATAAGRPAIVAAAARLGVPVRGYPAGLLTRIAVPNPSAAPARAVGTPSVAEAAALACGGTLLVPKRKSAPDGRRAGVTCAVASRCHTRWGPSGVEPGGEDMMSVASAEHGRRPGTPVARGEEPGDPHGQDHQER